MSTQPRVAQGARRPAGEARGAENELDRQLERLQAALLGRYAPETRVHRLRWSQGETQVLELGSGSPLLLVHGGLNGAWEWVPILPSLARNHRVLAVDRPGHGLADPFDYTGVDLLDHARTFLRDVVDALELDKVDMAGSSMGGLWSIVFAIDAPERVSRLVLVSAPAGAVRTIPLPLRLLGLSLKVPLVGRRIGRTFMSGATREGNRKFWGQLLVAHPERLDDLVLDVDLANVRRHVDSMLSLILCVGSVRGFRPDLILDERWTQLRVPTLILRGDRERFIRAKEKVWETIVARNPNIRIVPIAGAGHLTWFDDPDRVVGEIERFLENAESDT